MCAPVQRTERAHLAQTPLRLAPHRLVIGGRRAATVANAVGAGGGLVLAVVVVDGLVVVVVVGLHLGAPVFVVVVSKSIVSLEA